jgi:hypothetical protein
VGFDSEKGFTEVDENGNMANGIRVEVMEQGHERRNKWGGPIPVRQNGGM